ncbi:hypothetical protein FocnCong_v012862 [Fusarium oxysporum f. sp. conglutinans]|nr:hypothetical protein FocnCong_v012862 [Fusarium oxysporum f. sp. conglutinans]
MERRDFELPDPDWMRDLSHCPLSDRDKELLEKFWTELENDRMEHCARCQETWFDMGLKGGICKRCIARDKNKKEDEPWFFSAENQLDFGLIPAFLPQLTIVEEMLIARVHVFVNVMQVRGQQYKYRGHIVHFLRDVGKVYSQLPLLPPELDVILLRPPTASEHAHLNRQFRRQFRVRRRCLQEWLNFLSNNHPGYRGITVCQKRMSVLPEDGDLILGNIENDDVEPDEVDQSAVPDLLPEDTEMEALRSHVLGEERGEHLPVRPSTQHQLEMPDIRRTPINEFNHSQALLSLAFPTLFPRGQADFVEPRLRPIKYADYIQHALRWHDGRFARHPHSRFVVFNTPDASTGTGESSIFVKEYQQRQGLITRDDLLEAFQNPESAEAQQCSTRSTAKQHSFAGHAHIGTESVESLNLMLTTLTALVLSLHSARQTCTGGASINIYPSFKTGKSCPSNNEWACLANFSGTTHILQPGTSTGGLAYSEISFSSRNSTSLIIGTGMNGRVVEVAIAMAYSGWTVRLVLTWKMSIYVRSSPVSGDSTSQLSILSQLESDSKEKVIPWL